MIMGNFTKEIFQINFLDYLKHDDNLKNLPREMSELAAGRKMGNMELVVFAMVEMMQISNVWSLVILIYFIIFIKW